MGKGNDNDRYVVPQPQSAAVVTRASALAPTQIAAVGHAKEIVADLGGGEAQIECRADARARRR